MPAGKEGRRSKAIEWDEAHLDEECNARKCKMYKSDGTRRHKPWGLRKQKQVGSLTP